MQLFLVVIHSNVFTWLGRPEIWVETERRGVAGISHLMKGAFSQPVCFWDWNLYKLDQQVGYFPLRFQLNLPMMPHVPKVPERSKVHTEITSHKVYRPAAWLYTVVPVKSDTWKGGCMRENACICVLNTENHTFRSSSVFCPENIHRA